MKILVKRRYRRDCTVECVTLDYANERFLRFKDANGDTLVAIAYEDVLEWRRVSD